MNSGLKLIWSELLSIVNNPNSHTHETDAHQRRSNADFGDAEESTETYLMHALTNPLSLKQHARIVIRNRIIENMKHNQFVENYVLSHSKYQLNTALDVNSLKLSVMNATHSRLQQTSSILECLIWQLDLPRILHFYLYAFPDVPPMPEDIAVFVND